jgi:2-phospho-L-lactate guanylyltransferase (CobY/MobA/RfbA family)
MASGPLASEGSAGSRLTTRSAQECSRLSVAGPTAVAAPSESTGTAVLCWRNQMLPAFQARHLT